MGIQELQALLENEGVSVDLFRIRRNHAGGFKLVLDGEGCLDRLYGGYFSDWACGGQWARCVQFFVTLKSALNEHQVSICVCFNGAHGASTNGSSPPSQWLQTQANNKQRINSVLRHISSKGTPPPKVWWVPPSGLHSCLRNALRYLAVSVMVSTEDHHQEVVALCRERGYSGIIGNSGEYLIFQPPRYFCSSRLKLTYRSSLETKEYMVHNLPEWLNVPQERLCIFAALLGNTILTEQDLSEFYTRLSDNQKKINGEALIRAVANFVREFPSKEVDSFAADIFNGNDPRSLRFKQSVQYYVSGTKEGFLKNKSAGPKNKNKKPVQSSARESDLDTSRLASDANHPDLGELNLGPVSCMPGEWSENVNLDLEVDKKSKYVNNGNSNKSSSKDKGSASPFPVEVLKTCMERHSKGLMTPSLLTILTHRQITLPVLMEDENHRELPSIHTIFRPVRQNVYAILFNMHHYHYLATKSKEGEKQSPAPSVTVSEWIYTRQNPGKSPELVQGVMLDWPVPTVQRLWFGTTPEDKCRRIRAFLSCMKSDNQLMLNTSYVPQHLLVLACVLRYIMSTTNVLRRQELDAFLATAFATDLMNPLHLQEMTLSNITVRGVQLGALIMTGIDAALLANDACGAPIWWPFTCPWLYFDGKLFQQKLAKANTVKTLIQLCDNHVDLVYKVERMRKAILEGLDVEFAMPPLPMNPNLLSMGYPPPGVMNWNHTKGRGGALNNSHRGAGGRLEIAGVVVGQWGANYARSSQTGRYNPSQQLGYPGYHPQSQHNNYGSRGRGGGRGRPMTVGRGSLARRTRHRTTRSTGSRRRSDNQSNAGKDNVSINGKSNNGDEKNSSDGGVTDVAGDFQNDQSDNGESADGCDNSNANDGTKPAKTNKNKKNPMKGKKKTPQKESVKSSDDANNCQIAESCSMAGVKNKVLTKASVGLVNGNSGTNGEHKSQNDSPVHE